MKYIFIILLAIVLFGCTDNQKARGWGGEMTIKLEPGYQLINVTWKDSDMWLLTTVRPDTIKPRGYKFLESSTWGVWNGTVYIQEY